MDPLIVSFQFTVSLMRRTRQRALQFVEQVEKMECSAQRTDSLHCTGTVTAAFALKSDNSHRLLISCTCTTETIRRPTCTRSSSTTAFGSTAGFARNTAGGELGRLAEHPPPHKPHTLLTKLMLLSGKSLSFSFSHLVHCGNILPGVHFEIPRN